MTSASRAPELSAILRIVSCCTTVPSPSSAGPLDDFDDTPPLDLRQRACLHDAHRIARLCPLLVVGVDVLGANYLLAIQRVGKAARESDRHGLRHLVAHH